MEAARLPLRQVGYCVLCDAIVELTADGACANGHPAEVVAGRIVLAEGADRPRLPRFNWGAFAFPVLWGPAHGEWAGVVFLPAWLFLDNIVSTASGRPPFVAVFAGFAVAATLGAQLFFAKRGNGQAWRRVCDRMTVAEFVRRERFWTWACVALGAGALAWAVLYRLGHPLG